LDDDPDSDGSGEPGDPRFSATPNPYDLFDHHVMDYAGEHSHTTNPQGGGQAHENRPPYYALAFIMRTL
jgi:microcystin-dependent protein